jgi:PAS domain S-box-containing protein
MYKERVMLPRFRRYLAFTPFSDPIIHEQALLLRWFLYVLLATALAASVVSISTDPSASQIASMSAGLAMCLATLMALAVLRRGHFIVSLELAILCNTVATIAVMAPEGLESSRGIFALLVLPIVIAGLAGSRRVMWASATLGVLGVIVLALFHHMLLRRPISSSTYDPFLTCVTFAIAAVALGLVIDRFGATLRQALARAEQRAEEAQQAQEALRESEERYRLIADNTHDLIALLSVTGRYLYASPSFQAVLGFDSSTLLGTLSLRTVYVEDRGLAVEQFTRAVSQGFAQVRYRVVCADSEQRWVDVSLTAAERDGERYLVLVGRDITEQRLLEEQLQQALKMEAMGRVAGGVAHDFNNLLTVIGGCADLATSSLPPQHPMLSELTEIQRTCERASRLTSQLLAFARRQPVTPQIIEVGDLLGGVSGLLRRLIGDNITLSLEIAPGLWPVQLDSGQFEQVIINLAINARDAMPDGGLLIVSAANEAVVYEPSSAPIPSVQITVSDTGTGMSEGVQRRLFEPFFTTKAPGKGTGLGLAVCYGIVTQSGGRMQVTSTPGAGSSFTIDLPALVTRAKRQSRHPGDTTGPKTT